MKKYIIAAATIMAINNSPTFAQAKISTGYISKKTAGNTDLGAEKSSATEKEQPTESTTAEGKAQGRKAPGADQHEDALTPQIEMDPELVSGEQFGIPIEAVVEDYIGSQADAADYPSESSEGRDG